MSGYPVVSRTTAFDGHIFSIVADEVVMPGGSHATREYEVHPAPSAW